MRMALGSVELVSGLLAENGNRNFDREPPIGRKAVGCECMHFRMMRRRVALSLPDDTCPLSHICWLKLPWRDKSRPRCGQQVWYAFELWNTTRTKLTRWC